MRIRIISPGKVKEKWLQAGIDEYCKRLGRYCSVQVEQVADSSDRLERPLALSAEADRLLRRIRPNDYVIALDLAASQLDSPAFADQLMQWLETGGSEIVFVIGGSHGLDQSVFDRAQARLGLSRLTFTHQMARLILLEQCYRAFRILRNEPYHK